MGHIVGVGFGSPVALAAALCGLSHGGIGQTRIVPHGRELAHHEQGNELVVFGVNSGLELEGAGRSLDISADSS